MKKTKTKRNAGSKPKSKKQNPFDLKFTRPKHSVPGKKHTAGALGQPVAAKKKAIQQRQKTLAHEFNTLGKTNKFVDKRIGEKDATLSKEEKASRRFAEERVEMNKKASKFNLVDKDEDNEILTHGGRALSEVQKFDKLITSDDEDGDLGADLVASAHFGGGELGGADKPDRKDLISEMIARSKQTKLEKQSARNEQEHATETLDEKLNRVMQRGALHTRQPGEGQGRKDRDHYDSLLMDLKLSSDKKGQAAERKKTEKEEAEAEKERLEKLEKDRLLRINTKANSTHFSVDDDTPREKKDRKNGQFELMYDAEGKVVSRQKIERASIKRVRIDGVSDEEEEEDLDEEEMEDPDDEDIVDEEEGEEEETEPPTKKRISATSTEEKSSSASIPFALKMPVTFQDLRSLICKYEEHADVVLERLIACYHPSLAEGNKQHLQHLFLLLLRFYEWTAKKQPTSARICLLGLLTKPFSTLLKMVREHGVRCLRALLRSQYKLASGTPSRCPSFSEPATLRLVALLFPVSDVWHPVVTPAFLVATRSLARCQLRTLSTAAAQLLTLTSLSFFIDKSERYIPEAIAFLQGCLQLAVQGNEDNAMPSTAFPVSLPSSRMLRPKQAVKGKLTPLSPAEVFGSNGKPGSLEATESNRLRVLRCALLALRKFMQLYSSHTHTYHTVFSPLAALLAELPVHLYPAEMAAEVSKLRSAILSTCHDLRSLTLITRPKTEAKMLKMLEPRIEDDFDPDHPHARKKGAAAEKKKLKHLIKKEQRGAVKELRKDTAFIAKKKQTAAVRLDRERKVKTKRLLASLQTQESEHNKMLGKKKYQKH